MLVPANLPSPAASADPWCNTTSNRRSAGEVWGSTRSLVYFVPLRIGIGTTWFSLGLKASYALTSSWSQEYIDWGILSICKSSFETQRLFRNVVNPESTSWCCKSPYRLPIVPRRVRKVVWYLFLWRCTATRYAKIMATMLVATHTTL